MPATVSCNLSRWWSSYHSFLPPRCRCGLTGRSQVKPPRSPTNFLLSTTRQSVLRPRIKIDVIRLLLCCAPTPTLWRVLSEVPGALKRGVARACSVRKWHRCAFPNVRRVIRRPRQFHLIINSRKGVYLLTRFITHCTPRINKLWGPVQHWDKRGARPIEDLIGHQDIQSYCHSPPPPPCPIPSLPPSLSLTLIARSRSHRFVRTGMISGKDSGEKSVRQNRDK